MIRTLALFVCALGLSCAPSINAERKTSVDQQLAQVQAKANKYPRPFSPRVNFDPKPGQWARYKVVDKDGNPSFMTHKLLGRERNILDFETVTDSYYDRTIHRMKVRFEDDWKPAEFLAYQSKRDNEAVQNYDGPTLALINKIASQYLPQITMTYEGWPQEDTTVVAGTFPGCFRGTQNVSFGPWSSESDIWQHPIVPLSGLVKSQSKDGASMELLDFGVDGAQSEL